MFFFKKNPNEANYATGKKNFLTVLKNRGASDLLIWRQPEEDFNNNSTLIVMPGEVAVFINGGVVQQIFENGTYKLNTDNYPFLSRIRNVLSGGISTYNCVVFFLRKADSHEIRWGTSSPIQVIDPVYGIRTEAKSRGAYKVRIDNASKFVEKLAGNLERYKEQEDLEDYFFNEFQSKIKTEISKLLNGLQRTLIGVDAYLDELSQKVKPQINAILQSYGLICVSFSISGLDIDTAKYDAIDQSQLGLIAKTREVQGKKTEMDMLGENWGKQQAAEIMRDLANNSSAGGMGNLAAGLGMGIAAAGTFGGMAQQMFDPLSRNPQQNAPFNAAQQNAPFNAAVRSEAAVAESDKPAAEDPVEVLTKLKKMLDAGLITQQEYDAKKADILKRM